MTDPGWCDTPATSITSITPVTSVAELEALYESPPAPRSISKVLDHLSDEYRRVVEASPFFALATVGPEGMDCSPRGDRERAVFVVDQRSVHIPDRRGNNRLDSLRNIVRDGRVALLFLVPGVAECLRINGTATITADPALCTSYAVDGRSPTSVIVVTIAEVYFQCARAIKRADLWNPDLHADPASLPTAGQMTRAASADDFDAETYDAELPARQAATLW